MMHLLANKKVDEDSSSGEDMMDMTSALPHPPPFARATPLSEQQ